jgi:hypothetical protein
VLRGGNSSLLCPMRLLPWREFQGFLQVRLIAQHSRLRKLPLSHGVWFAYHPDRLTLHHTASHLGQTHARNVEGAERVADATTARTDPRGGVWLHRVVQGYLNLSCGAGQSETAWNVPRVSLPGLAARFAAT